MSRKPRTSASTPAAALLLVTGMLVLSCGHRSSCLPLEEEPAPTAPLSAAGKVFSLYFQRLTRERRTTVTVAGARSSSASPRVVEQLSPADLFIAVKSTARFHRSRLELLLETWMSRSMEQTFVFTDAEDPQLQLRLGDHLIHTHCSGAHTRQALSCKMFYEYDTFLRSGRKWLCHVDDDNYVNVVSLLKLLSQYQHTQDVYLGRPSTGTPLQASYSTQGAAPQEVRFWFATGGAGFCLSRSLALRMQPWTSGGAFMNTSDMIRLPDDCTVGFIVEGLLGVALTHSPLFHSHLENLSSITDLCSQVTLSYGPKDNTLDIRGAFSTQHDPTRFRSVHCLLYPDTPWCPPLT